MLEGGNALPQSMLLTGSLYDGKCTSFNGKKRLFGENFSLFYEKCYSVVTSAWKGALRGDNHGKGA